MIDVKFKAERKSLVMEVFSSEPYFQSSAFPQEGAADLQNSYLGPSPYHVNYCGYEICYPGYAFGPRSRTSYLLHVIYSGKGKYYVPGKVYDVSAGQLFLIYPGVTTTYQADVEDPWSYGWIGFSGHRSEALLSQVGFSPDHLVVTVEDVEPLRQCILSIMDTHRITYANELYRTAELLRFFSYIADHAEERHQTAPAYSKSVYAQLAMRYLDSNFTTNIKIADLADHIGIDRSYLTKSFRDEYQISPQEYLIRLRMEKAEQLLTESSESISVIAAKVGYADALAFSKIFKQRIGSSPSEYRKLHENDAQRANEPSKEIKEPIP
ncbi:AraC family transcriptional regulator [Agathobaculum sp. LCP25S3_E8]|uniref:AraC family transcriptional regulator n=1 Tax=Agathobaculum sp. LCP25S3_E8 TaxID=3438735 RepID=UPI003F91E747